MGLHASTSLLPLPEPRNFTPLLLTTHGKAKQAMFLKKIYKIFQKTKKARLWSVFSRVCIGFFFLRWSACSPAVAVGVLGGKYLLASCPFPVKNVTVLVLGFCLFSVGITLEFSAKNDNLIYLSGLPGSEN